MTHQQLGRFPQSQTCGIADCACRAMSLHVEDVQNWKDKHIRIMHLTAGLLIFAIGMAVIFEWI